MTLTFPELELDDDLCHAVADMGFTHPTSIQALVIPEALEGRDIMACAPTGTGKTLAYLLPLCQFLLDTPKNRDSQCRALILVPTRELALQVHEQCKRVTAKSHLSSGVITGGINYGTDKQTLDARPDILVATPGRLFEHIEKESLDCRDIESLVLDEADRMLDMGFSTIVNQIASEARWRKQSMLFSATLESIGVRKFADQLLNSPKEVTTNPSRKEKAKILQWYYLCDNLSHKDAIIKHLLTHSIESCIVFVKTRERLHALRDKLWADFPLVWLQGEMPQDKRMAAMEKFKSGEVKILLATDVAARGIDVKDVSHVVNYDMPRGADVYLHRIGRTGRGGAKGTAISLVEAHDYQWVGKISRFTGEPLKPRIIDELRPKHKAPTIIKKPKKKKTAAEKKRKTKTKGKRK